MIRISNTIQQKIGYNQIFEANKTAWNLISPAHENAVFYDIPNFVKTKNSLHKIEIDGLGNIEGKKILHLQPHICIDSISLAKKGALVTVVDFSKEALQIGRRLGNELNVELDFIENNVLNIDFKNQFDIVYLSYGALCWVPDLEQYFKLIHRALKKGGFFYFIDFHSNLLCYNTLTNKRKYYPTIPEEPIHEYRTDSYASTGYDKKYEVYYWIHSVSYIVNSLLSASFILNQIEEYDFLPFDCFPGLEQVGNKWEFKGNLKGLPLLVSTKSYK